MTHGTDQTAQQPTPTPCPTSPPPGAILTGPNTVAQCRAEYEAAADIRQTMTRQDAKAGRSA